MQVNRDGRAETLLHGCQCHVKFDGESFTYDGPGVITGEDITTGLHKVRLESGEERFFEYPRDITLTPIFHRNGVGGVGFRVSLSGGLLGIQFSAGDDDWHQAIHVPLTLFGRLVKAKRHQHPAGRADGWVYLKDHCRADTVTLIAFTDGKRVMVGVFSSECSIPRGEPAFAVFDWNLLEAGEIRRGDNSWRGDVYHGILRQVVPSLQF